MGQIGKLASHTLIVADGLYQKWDVFSGAVMLDEIDKAIPAMTGKKMLGRGVVEADMPVKARLAYLGVAVTGGRCARRSQLLKNYR